MFGKCIIFHILPHAADRITQRREQWVAIKIVTADRTGTSREPDSLGEFAKLPHQSTDPASIVELINDFTLEGPNGCHQCIVFELLGLMVNLIVTDFHEDNDRLPAKDMFTIATRLLQTVAFLHSIGYAHGGMLIYPSPNLSQLG